jgi:hypothetical protein
MATGVPEPKYFLICGFRPEIATLRYIDGRRCLIAPHIPLTCPSLTSL